MIHFEDAEKNKPLIFHNKTVDLTNSFTKIQKLEKIKIDYSDDELRLKKSLNILYQVSMT